MDRKTIQNYLPHRGRMLLLDDSVIIDEKTCIGHYTVKGDEYFLDGHFPDNPIVPGVILCEMMAQNSCLLLSAGQENNIIKKAFLVKMEKVKFSKPAVPNDTLTLKTTLVNKIGAFYYVVDGQVLVEDKIIASGQFTLFKE
ncbi:MAG: beta-hydroxyacyl-ACP dehydratase [Firmicutes bacterium]|nr:beta-hydroxyacyl-ACP dehydratase [Bacillota bacterium]